MDRSRQIIRTSVVGIVANLLLVAFKAVVGFLSGSVAIIMDAVPDIDCPDDQALCRQLTAEIQALVPDAQVVIVIDHNYSEA